MTRLSQDHWAMGLAMITARRATCLRRKVGCVLLDYAGRVLSTGFNGVAKGLPHCNDHYVLKTYPVEGSIPALNEINKKMAEKFLDAAGDEYPHACPGAHAASGTNLDGCGAIHAEQNAIMQCGNVDTIYTAYVTASPCLTCTKLLMNTGCKRIVYLEEYPHGTARDMWLAVRGNKWDQVTPEEMHTAL